MVFVGQGSVPAGLERHIMVDMTLGVDVDSEVFVKTAAEKNAEVIALSALLTTTMPAMAQTVKAAKEAGLAAKTMVGGAPVSQSFAEEIGAEGFGADAPGAVKLIKQLVSER